MSDYRQPSEQELARVKGIMEQLRLDRFTCPSGVYERQPDGTIKHMGPVEGGIIDEDW